MGFAAKGRKAAAMLRAAAANALAVSG